MCKSVMYNCCDVVIVYLFMGRGRSESRSECGERFTYQKVVYMKVIVHRPKRYISVCVLFSAGGGKGTLEL